MASWLMAQGPPRCGGDCDGARGSDTSGRPSQWSLPRPCITAGMQGRTLCTKPHGDRRRQAQGRGRSLLRRCPGRRRGAVTVGSVAAPVPLLAGAAGEAVDDRTLRFLLARSLAEKEEEEQRKAQVEGVAPGVLGACSGAPRVQEGRGRRALSSWLSSTTAVACVQCWFPW